MMGLLDDIRTLIVGIESNIFLGSTPDMPHNLMTIYHTGGADPNHSFEKRQYRNQTIQIKVRNMSYAIAENKLKQVSASLDGKTEIVINGTRYISIFQQGDVLPLGMDEKGRSSLTLNFRIRVES
ncbi:minor capsid protein [Paenibacillus naphthalenovorans]|uniref:minor capsid protein n=1 Tax=Paenibacillus naphthalenovorans TaxID=162209 RepID=UPI003D2750DB